MSLNSSDIEYAVAKHFGWRNNIIVPNISWGLGFRHELDLLILSKSNFVTEIEIKISVSDLKADLKKCHRHESNRIRRLFFAMPEEMKSASQYVPERAGILLVNDRLFVTVARPGKLNSGSRALDEEEVNTLLRLAHMRVWSLKETLRNKRRERQDAIGGMVP